MFPFAIRDGGKNPEPAQKRSPGLYKGEDSGTVLQNKVCGTVPKYYFLFCIVKGGGSLTFNSLTRDAGFILLK